MDVYEYAKPWESNAERMVDDALGDSQAPESVVRQTRPPLPQVVAFPPRFGWPSYAARQPQIREVLDFRRLYQDARDDTSGGPGEIDASARNVLVTGEW